MKKKTKSKVETTRVVILLDRTGSMSPVKTETIGSFNGYLDGLKDAGLLVKAVQFDSQGIDQIFDFVPPSKATRLNDKTYVPRAYTPLYDAIGQTVRTTRQECKGESKVMFVVLTDGNENASMEFNDASVKALIKECEDRDKWTFAYIGMGIEGWNAVQNMAAGTQSASNVRNVTRSRKGSIISGQSMAHATMAYCSSAEGMVAKNVFAGSAKDPDAE